MLTDNLKLNELILAINKLSKESKPKWGKMNCSQMLWHCRRFIIFYLNESEYSPNIFTYSLGALHMCFLKYVIRWNYRIYPKNTPSLKFFDASLKIDIDFEYEKKSLLKILNVVNDLKKEFVINPMHGKVSRKILKEVVRGHTSYHLIQFGVL